MNCDIIKDLLPSYADGLTSEASNEVVREHLAECKSCRDYYGKMKEENAPVLEKAGREIDYFLRVREDTIRKVMIAVVAVALIVTGLYAAYDNFYGVGRSAHSDEVALSVREREGGYELVFDSVDDGYRMNVGYTESEPVNGEEPVFTLHAVKYRRNPFDPNERRLQCINAYPFDFSGTNCFTVGYQNSWFDQSQLYYDENDFIAIEFADTVKTIRLSDLRAGDLSSLR